MPFPFTIGGQTFNEADFQNNHYKDNLGPFLSSLMSEGCNLPRCRSLSSRNWALGSKTFLIVETGLTFLIGQQMLIASPQEGLSMLGTVSAWNSGTNIVTINITHTNSAGGSNDNWHLYFGQNAISAGSIVGGNDGGIVTNITVARDMLGFPHPSMSSVELFEDFTGANLSITSATTPDDRRTAETYLPFAVGLGTVTPEYHTSRAAYERLPDLYRHPGVMELSVTNAGDAAAVTFGDYGQWNYGYFEDTKLTFGIFIPADRESPTDVWTFRLGFLKNNVIDMTSLAVVASLAASDSFGTSVGTSVLIGNSSRLRFEHHESGDSTYALGDALTLPTGRWLVVTFDMASSPDLFVTVADPLGTFSQVFTVDPSSAGDPAENANCGVPFVRLVKHSGIVKKSLYIDYVHMRCSFSR